MKCRLSALKIRDTSIVRTGIARSCKREDITALHVHLFPSQWMLLPQVHRYDYTARSAEERPGTLPGNEPKVSVHSLDQYMLRPQMSSKVATTKTFKNRSLRASTVTSIVVPF